MAIVAPSILASDFANISQSVSKLETWGASYVHCDVMDGVFVPAVTFGAQFISAIKPYTTLPMDVHLMITQPERHVEVFAKAGADIITVHQEATTHLHRTLQLIKDMGIKTGVALNPATSIATIENVLDMIDMVLLMTVNPGLGGQEFIPAMLNKVCMMKKMITNSGLSIDIQIDGGVTIGNAGSVVKAGADILVAGTTVFKADDPQKAIRELRGAS